jgi:HSP20 family molecular chaperone IbpA
MGEKSAAVRIAAKPAALQLVEAQTLWDRINRIHQNIARRAFEIFESNGGLWGHDLDDWLKAEAEMLHPVHLNMTELAEGLRVEAEVPGFNASELKICLEPRRLTISGKRGTSKEDKRKGKTIYQEQCSSELLRVIALPVDVDPKKTTATLKNGVLQFHMPKAGQAKGTLAQMKAA